jgi:virginiamycin B lyase
MKRLRVVPLVGVLVPLALTGLAAGPMASSAAWAGGKCPSSEEVSFEEFLVLTADSRPLGITVGPDGALWFVEHFGNKVGRITTEGTVTEFDIPTGTPGPLTSSMPDAIVTGPDGALWFTEIRGNKIGRITTEGAITEFPLPTPDSAPTVITVGPDGALWFTERGTAASPGERIGRITTDGVITEFTTPTQDSRPLGITTGRDRRVWFSESAANNVGRIKPKRATITEFAVPTPNSMPWEMTRGPDRAVWFTEPAANQIGRVTRRGRITEYAVPTVPPGRTTSAPNVIAKGPGRALYLTEQFAGQIGCITVRGKVTEYPIPSPNQFQVEPIGITKGPEGDTVWFTHTGSTTNPGERIGKLTIHE